MLNHTFFYLGISFILIHEMDAVRCKEWRIFPGLSLLEDNFGFKVFITAHIPLFFFLLWTLLEQQGNESLIVGLDVFFIIHVGLHLIFLMNKKNEFKDSISWIIISGAGLFGIIDLITN